MVAGGLGISMVVRLRSGGNTMIKRSFIIFRVKDRNYPIRNVLEFLQMYLCIQSERLMEKDVFFDWL